MRRIQVTLIGVLIALAWAFAGGLLVAIGIGPDAKGWNGYVVRLSDIAST